MNLNDFILQLQHQLKQGLPGEESQLRMTPYRRLVKEIPENRREGAVLLLLYKRQNNWYFPLIQRHAYEGIHSKQISFPGGKMEASENPLDTALRETYEEIGVLHKQIETICPLTPLYIPPSNFQVYPFLAFSEVDLSFRADPREVEEILEIPLEELLDDRNVRETLVEVQFKMKLKTPYFHLNDKVVWGATAAILSEFKDIIKNIV